MRDINFEKVGFENYSCYIEFTEFEFKSDTITLITGPNGTGKTSIVDVIPFTFYGITTKGSRSEELVNNVSGKNLHTYVNFSINENNITNKYSCHRYVSHSKYGDTVLLFRNDETKPYKKGQKETLPEIERLFIPQKLLFNLLLFGQKVKNFFTDLTDSEQKDIFRKVIQLDNWVVYYQLTSEKIKAYYKAFSDLENKISLNSSSISNINKNIELTKLDIKKFEEEKNKEIFNLTSEISILNNKLFELKEKSKLYFKINDIELTDKIKIISDIQNKINNIILDFNNKRDSVFESKKLKESEFISKINNIISKENIEETEEINKIRIEFNKCESEYNKELLEIKNDKNNHQLKIKQNEEKISKNNQEIFKLNSSLSTTEQKCPTCGKKLTNETVKNALLKTFELLKTESLNLTNEIIISKDFISKETEREVNLTNKYAKEKNDKDLKINNVKENHELKKNEISIKLNDAKEKLNELCKMKIDELKIEAEKNKKELEDNLDKLTEDKNKIQEVINEKNNLEKEINKTESDIKTTEYSLKLKNDQKYNEDILKNFLIEKQKLIENKKLLNIEKDKVEDDIKINEFWKEGFSSSGIPSFLIDESIPFLNTRVKDYLDMVGGRYQASFDTLSQIKSGEFRDKIKVNVLDTQTKANSRKQLSGGQTRIIDIAILLSLCDLQNKIQDMKTNILLLDEIFDSLDDQNIGYVSTLLRSLVKGKSINLISHRHIDTIEADQTLRFYN